MWGPGKYRDNKDYERGSDRPKIRMSGSTSDPKQGSGEWGCKAREAANSQYHSYEKSAQVGRWGFTGGKLPEPLQKQESWMKHASWGTQHHSRLHEQRSGSYSSSSTC